MANSDHSAAFEQWLSAHPKNGQTQCPIIQVNLIPGLLPGRTSYDYDVIAYDDLGIVLKFIAQQSAPPEFYPWSAILRMV